MGGAETPGWEGPRHLDGRGQETWGLEEGSRDLGAGGGAKRPGGWRRGQETLVIPVAVTSLSGHDWDSQAQPTSSRVSPVCL